MNSLPHWLKKKACAGGAYPDVKKALADFSVNTVCESSRCPNSCECFSSAFATFLILGKVCTRSCSFCSADKTGVPWAVDQTEPERVARCVERIGLKYAVITSVTRDDLDDGGAAQFVRTVASIRRAVKDVTIELLIPDFTGDERAISAAASSGADVVGHNIETVGRMYPLVRKEAGYERSLGVLRSIKRASPGVVTKSAILAGLGELPEEIIEAMRDLREADCDILTIGQYLRPSPENRPVARFVPPEEFESLKVIGEGLGFKSVNAGPFARSSYMAEKYYKERSFSAYNAPIGRIV